MKLRKFRIEDNFIVDESGMRVGKIVAGRFDWPANGPLKISGPIDAEFFDYRFCQSNGQVLDWRENPPRAIAKIEGIDQKIK